MFYTLFEPGILIELFLVNSDNDELVGNREVMRHLSPCPLSGNSMVIESNRIAVAILCILCPDLCDI